MNLLKRGAHEEMADAVITFLLKNLTKTLSQEADLLLGVKKEVESLEYQLRLTQAYLKGLRDRPKEQQPINVEFNNQVRDAAHKAEDIIEGYVACVAQHRGKSYLDIMRRKLVQWFDRRRVADEIKSIKKRFEEIHRDREKFGIQINQQGGDLLPMEDDCSSSLRSRRLLVEESDVVGFDKDAEMIKQRLTEGVARRDVIPLVGMGGIGKTTLARKVFNDPVVAKHFDFRAWVSVYEGLGVRDLFQAIMKCAMGLTSEELKGMRDEELGFELRKYLRSTRYLIVLDDVWSSDLWRDLAPVFANNTYGSRIILTTRHDEVAQSVNSSSPPHKLRFLSKEESWDLFSRKVFPEGRCPSDLEELGKQMVDKCGGLPLAIVVLAGVLLKREKTSRWWSKVSSSESSLFTQHTDHCKEILQLSYNNLPHHLRPCYLYFGLLPKDFEIPATQLVRLWIAEGFVQENDRETMEEVGEEYLEELISRNLIQVSTRRFDGTIKTCCIHDLLQDLCIRKAVEENFLEDCGNGCSSYLYNSRRVGLHSNMLKYICSNPSSSTVRSILCCGLDERNLSPKEWKLLRKGFPLLRVLDTWEIGVEVIPKEIDQLIHLRYLRLKSLTAKTLPASSISNLWNLQTLEVTAPCIDRPQIDIWKMQELRHLNFRGQGVIIPQPPKEKVKDSGTTCTALENLLTLSCISPDSCTGSVFSKLPKLVKLGILGDLGEHMNLLFEHLSTLNCLQTLKLIRDRRCTELNSLPYGVAKFPPNLTKLTLIETQLLEDPMDILGQLPHLQVLKLKNSAYGGRELNCPVNRFPELRVLKLVNLAVRSWTISEGSMRSLKSVVVNRCGQLHGLPPALQSIPGFQELELWSPNVSLANEARDIETSRGKEQFKLVIYQF